MHIISWGHPNYPTRWYNLGAGRKAGEICFKYSKVFQTYSSLTYVQFANKIKLIKCGNDNFAVEKMKKI